MMNFKRLGCLLLLPFLLCGEEKGELETREARITYLLPEDCSDPENSTPHAITEDDTLWMFLSPPKKVAKLREGDLVKIWEGAVQGLMFQEKRDLHFSVVSLGTVKGAPATIAACGEIAGGWNYLLINNKAYQGISLPVTYDDGEEEWVPSLAAGWYPGDQVLFVPRGNRYLNLVNTDLREVALANAPVRTKRLAIEKSRHPEHDLTDGATWTVFPEFSFSVEVWDKRDTLRGFRKGLIDWFQGSQEAMDEYLGMLLTVFGDPGWESTEDIETLVCFNIESNELAVFWRRKEA